MFSTTHIFALSRNHEQVARAYSHRKETNQLYDSVAVKKWRYIYKYTFFHIYSGCVYLRLAPRVYHSVRTMYTRGLGLIPERMVFTIYPLWD